MISGYNTDVPFEGVVYHVQTEDKGVTNPLIESLVYVGGQVVAAKRESYADLLAEGAGQGEISRRMDHQHRILIAAIRSGKFEERRRSLLGTPAAASPPAPALSPPAAPSTEEGPPAAAGRTLDQVILDYLQAEAAREHLELRLASASPLAVGRPAQLRLEACSSRTGSPVGGAEVAVRMISTLRGSATLGRGVTDEQGRVELAVEIPELRQGTAALIITASSRLGSAEIKHLL